MDRVTCTAEEVRVFARTMASARRPCLPDRQGQLRLGDRQPIRPSAQATIRVVGERRWRAPATVKNSLFVSIRSDHSAKTKSHRD